MCVSCKPINQNLKTISEVVVSRIEESDASDWAIIASDTPTLSLKILRENLIRLKNKKIKKYIYSSNT